MGLQGTWHNELGSTLVVTEVTNGTVKGTYETATGGLAVGKFEVVGRTDTDPQTPGGQTVGFSVAWINDQSQCKSTTSWCGEYFTVGGVEQLSALWLLVSETTSAEEWASTQVGKDVFWREASPPEQLAQARQPRSHP
jgi:avidin family protein